ncbi:MAG: type-F conjugative transfer system protein TraW [Betaproteobacteria bacterium AqS2]|uniref:Type-F conjugative transfer system protein TraW n=1 Tax=Candidatus Amphirhobacter heronislandensis TaxID=1732024 RepID=A0A930UHL8_9GAMM|nr:type-F conjugative transfer system protein TraW [Betaproteobacteria bacterium AqS2]
MKRRWASLAGIAAELGAALGLLAAVHAGQSLGPLHPIAEPDLREAIELAVRRAYADGSIAAELEAARARAIAYADRPPPVAGLAAAAADSARLFDPSVVVEAPAVAPGGEVLAAAGTRVNPLAQARLGRPLLFLDADDPAQLRLAQRLLAAADATEAPRPVLVGGSLKDFAAATGARPFFDQGGVLVRRLAIDEVPALVAQQGQLLSIKVFGVAGDGGGE